MTYYVSGGFKDIKGIVSNTGIKQGDLRANLTANLSKSVTMALDVYKRQVMVYLYMGLRKISLSRVMILMMIGLLFSLTLSWWSFDIRS